jgi:protease-4
MVTAFLRTFSGLLGLVVGIFFSLILLGILFSQEEQSQTLRPPHLSLKPTAMPNQEGEIETEEDLPLILELPVRGVIGTPGLDRKWIDQVLLQMKRPPFAHRQWAGVLLVLQTPGGTVDDSVAIFHRVQELKQRLNIPVVALVQGVCASGGIYVACAADEILSEPEAMVGSVGVLLGPTFNLVGGMDKLGIQAYTLTEGLDKDTGNPFRPWRPDEFAPLQAIARSTYAHFVQAVATARPQLSAQQISCELGARVFLAEEAQKLGLIDDAGASRRQALDRLMERAQISQAQIIEFQAPLQVLEELLTMGSKAVFRLTQPWKPSWSYGLKSSLLLIAPQLAGE